jgi:branched-chain amino acid aminotransferase
MNSNVIQTKEDEMKSDCIWMDGDLVFYDEAKVHILNPTMHYGTGIFEGIRCYDTHKGPAVFRLKEHLSRLLDSAQIAGIQDIHYTLDELNAAVHQTIRANGFASCYIRPLVYMEGPLGLDLDDWRSVVTIAVWEWGPFLGKEAAERGVRMMVSSFTRHHPNVMMTKAKITGNYVNSTLAKTVAHRAGFDEALLLDPNGYVAECSGENLFMVREGVIYTSPRNTILEGITRDTLITLARDMGTTVVEEPISRDQLYIADEVFICGTAAEVVPVREIDFRQIGDQGNWPITAALQRIFMDTVLGKGDRSHQWLDYVDETVYAV